MKISNLPYYVKFVFLSDDTAFSTSDVDMLSHVKNADTHKRIHSLNTGDRIVFEPQELVYRITDISINHLFEDTKDMLLCIDLEDATSMQGVAKEWLLKLTITIEPDNKEA